MSWAKMFGFLEILLLLLRQLPMVWHETDGMLNSILVKSFMTELQSFNVDLVLKFFQTFQVWLRQNVWSLKPKYPYLSFHSAALRSHIGNPRTNWNSRQAACLCICVCIALCRNTARASGEWSEYSLIRMTSHLKEWENERMPQPQSSFIWSNRFNTQNWTDRVEVERQIGGEICSLMDIFAFTFHRQ